MVVHEVVGIALAFIALAAFASAISPNSQMNNLLQTSLGGFNSILTTAISPVGANKQ